MLQADERKRREKAAQREAQLDADEGLFSTAEGSQEGAAAEQAEIV